MNAPSFITVVKIGGQVLDDEVQLTEALHQFQKIQGAKVLIHGGGKLATELAQKLSVTQTMIEGRRVTDAETLKIAVMVYAGLINKTLVAKLHALGSASLGMTGADGDLIRSKLRSNGAIDYGFVGDPVQVNVSVLFQLLVDGLVPVIAPITHDGSGQLLNTNADTIAQSIATALAAKASVHLIYSFEKSGVLRDVSDESSVISRISRVDYQKLKSDGVIFAGMIPKLDNAFFAIERGVKKVSLGKASALLSIQNGATGTTLSEWGDSKNV